MKKKDNAKELEMRLESRSFYCPNCGTKTVGDAYCPECKKRANKA